jgi:hypothetical protein
LCSDAGILESISKEADNQPGLMTHPVIPALWRLRQELHEFEVSMGLHMRHCLKKKTKN